MPMVLGHDSSSWIRVRNLCFLFCLQKLMFRAQIKFFLNATKLRLFGLSSASSQIVWSNQNYCKFQKMLARATLLFRYALLEHKWS